MAVYEELLPPSKSSPHSGIRWTPAEADYSPVCGVLVIQTKRCDCEYLVTEFVPGWDGRAFNLTKLGEGADKTEENYAVFVARSMQDKQCECKGFSFAGHCKHVDAIKALLENGWV